jgi:hypothetical protein
MGFQKVTRSRHNSSIFSDHLKKIRKELTSYCRHKIIRLKKEEDLDNLLSHYLLCDSRHRVEEILQSKASINTKIAQVKALLESILAKNHVTKYKDFYST